MSNNNNNNNINKLILENLKGKFIVIEGPDRVGKTTLIKNLTLFLNNNNIKTYNIRFPNNNNVIGNLINDILINKSKYNKIKQDSLNLLFLSDMINESENIIEKIKENYVIICDRYYFSTLIYGISSLKNETNENLLLNIMNNMLKPDILCILKGCINELKNRDGYGEQVTENINYQTKVIENYKKYVKIYSNYCSKYFFIDVSNKTENYVLNEVINSMI